MRRGPISPLARRPAQSYPQIHRTKIRNQLPRSLPRRQDWTRHLWCPLVPRRYLSCHLPVFCTLLL
jgi:hypothetical protein